LKLSKKARSLLEKYEFAGFYSKKWEDPDIRRKRVKESSPMDYVSKFFEH
jgi:hypothetical protein